jgi:tetratricopeptide (TPR) repeat protein
LNSKFIYPALFQKKFMKKTIFFLFLCLTNLSLFAQNSQEAEKLITEGVELNDKGDFAGAIAMYDKAFELDSNNFYAYSEKAYTLIGLEKYSESIENCQKAIALYPNQKGLDMVYITYGNALDLLKKPDESIKIYNEGIRLFPKFHMLFYNKAITLAGLEKTEEAIVNLHKSMSLNPKHAGSQNAIAQLEYQNSHKIPALLAYSRFLIIEPQGQRAEANLKALQSIMSSYAKETGEKSVTIKIDAESMKTKDADGTVIPNNFSSVEVAFGLSTALDFDKKYKKQTLVEKFIRNFEFLAGGLSVGQNDNTGFYWAFYAPYFIEMKEKGFMNTFGYLAHAESGDKDVIKWLEKHEIDIDKFYEWSSAFVWKTQ